MFDESSTNSKPKMPANTSTPAPLISVSSKGQSTVIGASSKIKGELFGEEDLIIQGNVEGSIKLQNNSVSVGEHGRIHADVFAKTITVQGELSGDLHGTEKVTVTSSGKVKGNIIAPKVVLEEGALFKGSIDMDSKPAESIESDISSTNPAKPKTA